MALTPEDIAAITRLVEAALAPVEQRLTAQVQGLQLGTQQVFRELSDRMARLEARVESLTASIGAVAGKLVGVEAALAEVSERIGRLSADMTRGFTLQADRYADLERRIVALEAIFAQDRG